MPHNAFKRLAGMPKGIINSASQMLTDDTIDKELSSGGKQYKYTFSSQSFYAMTLRAYVVQKYLKENSSDFFTIVSKYSYEYNYDVDKYQEIILEGVVCYVLNNQLIVLTVDDVPEKGLEIQSNKPIDELVEILKNEITYKNPLRNKHSEILETNEGIVAKIRNHKKISFESLIMEEEMKKDIIENTIFHLKNMETSNGIILYGEPGTGKTLTCDAIITEALASGYSTCFTTSQLDYSYMKDFIESFLGECVVIFEDIDSLAQNRTEVLNSQLAGFLQFINGLSDNKNKLLFIATTNYLEHLDPAVKSRPARFNRKFHFQLPDEDAMKKLIQLYFKDIELTDELMSLCYGKNFTGSHILEIFRTAQRSSKLNKTDIKTEFENAVHMIEKHFTNEFGKIGFKKK